MHGAQHSGCARARRPRARAPAAAVRYISGGDWCVGRLGWGSQARPLVRSWQCADCVCKARRAAAIVAARAAAATLLWPPPPGAPAASTGLLSSVRLFGRAHSKQGGCRLACARARGRRRATLRLRAQAAPRGDAPARDGAAARGALVLHREGRALGGALALLVARRDPAWAGARGRGWVCACWGC